MTSGQRGTLYTVKEAAAILGLAPKTVNYWISKGVLPTLRRKPICLILKYDLIEFKERREARRINGKPSSPL